MTRDEANRINALASTGPRTPAGKARSAQNATTHGLLSRATLLPDDDADTFDAFAEALIAELAPVGAVQRMLADRVVGQAWRLRRAAMLDAALLAYERDGADLFASVKGDERALGFAFRRCVASGSPVILSRYESAIERGMFAALAALRTLQETNATPCDVVIDGEAEPVTE